jgi:hypothetical protein
VVGLLADPLFVVAIGQLDGHMQPGGDTMDSGLRERLGERLDEGVTPAAVADSHAPQVAVQLAASQEVGERVLLDAGGSPVGEELLVADGLQQRRRHNQPTDPQRRRQRLARRAGVDDPIRIECVTQPSSP